MKKFQDKGDEYKVELINELEDGSITYTRACTDLCRGPHLPDTSPIKAIVECCRCILAEMRSVKC